MSYVKPHHILFLSFFLFVLVVPKNEREREREKKLSIQTDREKRERKKRKEENDGKRSSGETFLVQCSITISSGLAITIANKTD